MLRLSILFVIFSLFLGAKSVDPKLGIFTGRVSKVHEKSSLLRLKVEFGNFRYVNKKDRVELWNEHAPKIKCEGFVVGKSNDYALLKIMEFNDCEKKVSLAPGMHIRLFSQDLVNNLTMGREVVKILLKKRLALRGKLHENKKELDSHIEKVNAVNMRFKRLRDKLEAQWRKHLNELEEDKAIAVRNYEDLLRRKDKIDHKLEKYKISGKNLKTDRWALDPHLYYDK